MRSLIWISTILFALAIFFISNSAFAQTKVKEEPWAGTLNDGTKINDEDLTRILTDHKKWLDTEGREGKKADLQEARLLAANLQEAYLEGADLQKANLGAANLQEAYLEGADLQKANLGAANLQGARLLEANLQEARLPGADLQKANLGAANLQGARLLGADLQKAYLVQANLQKANLEGADLQEAFLGAANLQGARLLGANLQEAYLARAHLNGAVFEIEPGKLPNIPSIAKARFLSLLTYHELPHSLVELRAEFKKSGLRKQEREITYAIKHSGFIKAKSQYDFIKKVEVYLGWFFFELTCQWGMSPERPLFILLMLIFLFTLPYAQAIYGKEKVDGIWKVWISERMRVDLGHDEPKKPIESINPLFCFKNGFYFSLLSAFNIGWRELNVGNWMARMQPYEYRLQATGWARTVSGIQSLISVYLLALSVLTYFGRPFESY
jgi:uncharacterized protein YjbI with pentapeptide repeats